MDDETGKEWYVMDSAWIEAWLAYTHGDKTMAPAPGPCRNHRLITFDYAEGKWKGRFGLWMARKEQGGDFRRVSKEVWEQFVSYYPGSGPAISMTFDAGKMDASGVYDTSTWTIVNPPPSPKEKKKKKIQLKRLSLLGNDKGDKNGKDKEMKAEGNSGKLENGESKLPISQPLPKDIVISQAAKDSDDDDDVAQPNPPTQRLENRANIIRDPHEIDSDDDEDDLAPAPGVVRRAPGDDLSSLMHQTKTETNIAYAPRASFSSQRPSASAPATLSKPLDNQPSAPAVRRESVS